MNTTTLEKVFRIILGVLMTLAGIAHLTFHVKSL